MPYTAAIVELEAEYESVAWEADGSGGAYVTVAPLVVGPRWEPSEVPITFQVAFNYPFAAIYPFYTTHELNRIDGGAWPSARPACPSTPTSAAPAVERRDLERGPGRVPTATE